jgi:hypothetical protein
MTYRGHIKDGQITLDQAVRLPEGAEVNVEVVANGDGNAELLRQRRARRIRLDPELSRQIASLAEFHPDEL